VSEHHEPHPLLSLWLTQHSFVGGASGIEDNMMPAGEQLNFGPGDMGILAGSNVPLENDFGIVRAVSPELYAETFPDWEERVMRKSFVLVEKFSRNDPEISLGWVALVKVMPIEPEYYQESLDWLEKGFPETIPDWCSMYYRKFTDMLSEQAPDVVPRSVVCPNCESPDVNMVIVRRLEYTCRAGQVVFEGSNRFVPTTNVDEHSTHVAELRCLNCKSTADLDDDEWYLPGISN
jgi:hypothetical protein